MESNNRHIVNNSDYDSCNEKISAHIKQQQQQLQQTNDSDRSSNIDNEKIINDCLSKSDINYNEDRTIRHILVVGFHHKHGYQVDYCYPPLKPGSPVFSSPGRPIVLPSSWKTLPILCLPDGSHNYDNDTIYFTMPDLNQEDPVSVLQNNQTEFVDKASSNDRDKNNHSTNNTSIKAEGIKTIFGTACYRQIKVEKLLNKTDDMTRLYVQKSVCVLSSKPLFGIIRSKLEMITHAYFEELDFSRVQILKLTYENLNSLLSRESGKENTLYLGLSARELVSVFGCNILVLFKAMLLEKRILFYKSPVRELCKTILSMCSLFTGLLENGGLDRSTCDIQLSPTIIEALRLSASFNDDEDEDDVNDCDTQSTNGTFRDDKVFFNSKNEEVTIIPEASDNFLSNLSIESKHESKKSIYNSNSDLNSIPNSNNTNCLNHEDNSRSSENSPESSKLVKDSSDSNFDFVMINDGDDKPQLKNQDDSQDDEENPDVLIDDPSINKISRMSAEELGLPLQVFSRGSFCLPYLSITYLDLIADPRVKSFVIGATNFLFKQRRDYYDIIVDMDSKKNVGELDIIDPNLRRCLSLTTEDLRFIDYLKQNVRVDQAKRHQDEFDFMNQDITKWLGSDEWIRYMFKIYTIYLLKASKYNSNTNQFNNLFVQAWKKTNNYKIWESQCKSSVLASLQARHPFSTMSRGYNLRDVKLRLSYAVNNSDKGKMINQTLSGIGSIWSSVSNTLSIPQAIISSASSSTTKDSYSSATVSEKTGQSKEVEDI